MMILIEYPNGISKSFCHAVEKSLFAQKCYGRMEFSHLKQNGHHAKMLDMHYLDTPCHVLSHTFQLLLKFFP